MMSPALVRTKTALKAHAPQLLTACRELRRASGLDGSRKRRRLTDFVRQKTNSVVASGPFAGMRLIRDASWGDGDVAPKLLGVYEQELHDWIEVCATRSYDAIVDVGCAEGFYAVGLARRFPQCRVYAFDTDPAALAITRLAAIANGVEAQVLLRSRCDTDALLDLCARCERLLIVSDCEGYEVGLFSHRAVLSALRRSDLIIECHDDLIANGSTVLKTAFGWSHTIQTTTAGGRNPNRFGFLTTLHEADRWQAVCENRPCLSQWLFCKAA